MKEIGGLSGVIARLALRFAKKHMDALMILAECETTADIVEFKKTEHYAKIKNSEISAGHDLKQLEKLVELENLEKLNR